MSTQTVCSESTSSCRCESNDSACVPLAHVPPPPPRQAHTAQHYRILKGPLATKIEEDAQQAIADAFNQPVRLVLAVVHKRTRSKGAKRQLKELGMTLSH